MNKICLKYKKREYNKKEQELDNKQKWFCQKDNIKEEMTVKKKMKLKNKIRNGKKLIKKLKKRKNKEWLIKSNVHSVKTCF